MTKIIENKNSISTDMESEICAKIFEAAPHAAIDIWKQLDVAGFDSYFVGGCVRDVLNGKRPHDWDIATQAMPEQMKNAISYKSFDTGIAHGTVTFVNGDEPYEVTTFRSDGKYSDGRRPDSISFVASIKKDLARRDFTMNAMAYSPKIGFVDPFGGFSDLRNGLLRGVGDAKERFCEDGLRIMRALRFAATHNVKIEPDTASAMHEVSYMLENVSEERITSEWMRMLAASDGQHLASIIDEFSDVVITAIPELSFLVGFEQDNYHHDRDLWQHSVDTMALLKPDSVLRFAGLVHDIGKPLCKEIGSDGIAHYFGHMEKGREVVEAMCSRMKMSNDDTEKIAFLVGNHDNRPRDTKKTARRFLVRMGSDEMLYDMLELMRADISTHAIDSVEYVMPRFEAACDMIEVAREEELAMKINDLEINGNDLIGMGFVAGPILGAVLKELFDRVVDGEILNGKRELLDVASNLKEGIEDGHIVLNKDHRLEQRFLES